MKNIKMKQLIFLITFLIVQKIIVFSLRKFCGVQIILLTFYWFKRKENRNRLEIFL